MSACFGCWVMRQHNGLPCSRHATPEERAQAEALVLSIAHLPHPLLGKLTETPIRVKVDHDPGDEDLL